MGWGNGLNYCIGESPGIYSKPVEIRSGAIEKNYNSSFIKKVFCGTNFVHAIGSAPFIRVVNQNHKKKKFLIDETTTCKDILIFCKVAWGIDKESHVLTGKSGRIFMLECVKEILAQGTHTLFLEQKKKFQSTSGSEIKFKSLPESDTQIVEGGTLNKLVEKLTYEGFPDPNFVRVFLLTYPTFTDMSTLLDMLEKRYSIQPSLNLKGEALERFKLSVQTPIRLRVSGVFNEWFKSFPEDFNEEMCKKMSIFINKIREINDKINEKIFKAYDRLKYIGFSNMQTERFPEPIRPSLLNNEDPFLGYAPVEIARQLSLIEFNEYFAQLTRKDLLWQSWSKSSQQTNNCSNLISRFRSVSEWITKIIVKEKKLTGRRDLIQFCIDVAEQCCEIGNHASAIQILTGLSSYPVRRLRNTWNSTKKKLSALEKNYLQLKKKLLAISSSDYLKETPILSTNIAFIGVFLIELAFIESEEHDFLENKLINFEKRIHISKVLECFQQCLLFPPRFAEVSELKTHLLSVSGWKNEHEKESLQMSIDIEVEMQNESLDQYGDQWLEVVKETFLIFQSNDPVNTNLENQIELLNREFKSILPLDSTSGLDSNSEEIETNEIDSLNLLSSKTVLSAVSTERRKVWEHWILKFRDTTPYFEEQTTGKKFNYLQVFAKSKALEYSLKSVLIDTLKEEEKGIFSNIISSSVPPLISADEIIRVMSFFSSQLLTDKIQSFIIRLINSTKNHLEMNTEILKSYHLDEPKLDSLIEISSKLISKIEESSKDEGKFSAFFELIEFSVSQEEDSQIDEEEFIPQQYPILNGLKKLCGIMQAYYMSFVETSSDTGDQIISDKNNDDLSLGGDSLLDCYNEIASYFENSYQKSIESVQTIDIEKLISDLKETQQKRNKFVIFYHFILFYYFYFIIFFIFILLYFLFLFYFYFILFFYLFFYFNFY